MGDDHVNDLKDIFLQQYNQTKLFSFISINTTWEAFIEKVYILELEWNTVRAIGTQEFFGLITFR